MDNLEPAGWTLLWKLWLEDNDVVRLMALDLKDLCDLTIIDTHLYDGNSKGWCENDYTDRPQWPIRWLNKDKVINLAKEKRPDFALINSGGMSFTPSTVKALKDIGIVIVAITLSDSDVFHDNGRIYSKLYDICYTNSSYAYQNLYDRAVNIKLLPFAASPRLHRPLNEEKIYDVVVGHSRPDRVNTVRLLQDNFNVGLFGDGWRGGHGAVHGEEHVKAINSGKIYLSFSMTLAGYSNMKVGIFEAIACNTCVITEYFDEMGLYFKYGSEILGYVSD